MQKVNRILISSVMATCLGLAAQTSFAQATNTNTLSSAGHEHVGFTDERYLHKAAELDLMSIKVGQLASEKGTTSEIKNLGTKMVQQHTQSYQELTKLAESKGVKIPTAVSKRGERSVEHISSRTGTDFDKAVLRHLVKEQEADVRATETASTKSKDPQIKQHASNSLATLRDELKQARTLYAQEKSIKEPAGTKK